MEASDSNDSGIVTRDNLALSIHHYLREPTIFCKLSSPVFASSDHRRQIENLRDTNYYYVAVWLVLLFVFNLIIINLSPQISLLY